MTGRSGIQAFSWVLALAVGANPGAFRAQAQTESGEKVYQRTLRATAWIVVPRGEPGGGRMSAVTGTGSLVDHTRRLIVTNYHVVGESAKVYVLFPAFINGKLKVETSYYKQQFMNNAGIPGEVIARDAKHDLALVRVKSVPEGIHALRLAADGVNPGQRVHSIGNPGMSAALWVYTSGTVRTPAYRNRWSVREGDKMLSFDSNVIETQSPTNQGDSGGPLVNDQGELVGVTHGYAPSAQLLSLFIDASEVRKFLKSNKFSPNVAPESAARASKSAAEQQTDDAADDSAKLERAAAS
jgi:S1-C subfamily serine protease